MAKRKVNKSEEIRQFAAAHPDASANDIVKAMKAKRISVSAQTVATVKSKAGLTKGKRRGPKKRAKTNGKVTTGGKGHLFGYDVLVDAKKLCVSAGNAELAIEAVRTINRLESMS